MSGTGIPLAGFGVGAGGGAFGATAAGEQIPDLVANLSLDQPWGSVQLSGAAHQLRTSIYPAAGAICGVTAAGLVGIAGLGGVSCNALAGSGMAPWAQPARL